MTSKPRSAASQATPAPVAPPPITSTSALTDGTAVILCPAPPRDRAELARDGAAGLRHVRDVTAARAGAVAQPLDRPGDPDRADDDALDVLDRRRDRHDAVHELLVEVVARG